MDHTTRIGYAAAGAALTDALDRYAHERRDDPTGVTWAAVQLPTHVGISTDLRATGVRPACTTSADTAKADAYALVLAAERYATRCYMVAPSGRAAARAITRNLAGPWAPLFSTAGLEGRTYIDRAAGLIFAKVRAAIELLAEVPADLAPHLPFHLATQLDHHADVHRAAKVLDLRYGPLKVPAAGADN